MTYAELKAAMDAKKCSEAAPGENTGAGIMSQPKVSHDALVGTWTVLCLEGDVTFSVTDPASAEQTNVAALGVAYISDDAEVSFEITQGDPAFVAGDVFTFVVADNVIGMNDAAIIREIEYRIHSKVDDVEVGYDAVNNAVRVIMVD